MTDKELDKNAARRLAIIRHAQEVTGNVAMTCRYSGIGLFRIANGRIVEDFVQEDTFGLLQQLGAIPAPGRPTG